MDNKIPIFILTCKSAPDSRLSSACAQLAPYENSHLVTVIDGPIPGDPGIGTLYDVRSNRRRTNRDLSPSEIAVYATHRLAWQQIVDNGADCGLVLEDDFSIRDPELFSAALSQWPALCQHGDIIKFYDYPQNRPNAIVRSAHIGALHIVKWREPKPGTVAYLITRQGAEKLLSRKQIFRPVDEDFKYFWELRLHVWSIVPAPMTEISDVLGGSLVNKDRRSTKSRHLYDRIRGNWINVRRKVLCRYHFMRGY